MDSPQKILNEFMAIKLFATFYREAWIFTIICLQRFVNTIKLKAVS